MLLPVVEASIVLNASDHVIVSCVSGRPEWLCMFSCRTVIIISRILSLHSSFDRHTFVEIHRIVHCFHRRIVFLQ